MTYWNHSPACSCDDCLADNIIIPFAWEQINQTKSPQLCRTTLRAQTIGGWIVKEYVWVENNLGGGTVDTSMVFIPDPEHKWEIKRNDRTNKA